MDDPTSCNVTFQPSGRRGPATAGRTLLEIARELGVEIETTCGGKGSCHKCRVRIESDAGRVSQPTSVEEKALGPEALDAGIRLACQARVTGDVRVFVPQESRRAKQVVRKEAGQRTVPVDPAIKCYAATLKAPSLYDHVAVYGVQFYHSTFSLGCFAGDHG